MSEDAGKLE